MIFLPLVTLDIHELWRTIVCCFFYLFVFCIDTCHRVRVLVKTTMIFLFLESMHH